MDVAASEGTVTMPATLETLTYCTNIHPGESLGEVTAALLQHTLGVKERVSPGGNFNVGLRLSNGAVTELADEPAALERFSSLVEDNGLYVTTLNGFPFGAFHGTRVKENVYRPDWQEPERIEYTRKLANVLAELLPDGAMGSISSVPGCFKPRVAQGSVAKMARHLIDVVAHLVEVERHYGKHIVLALEAEPSCLLETTDEVLRFFETELWRGDALARLSKLLGLDATAAERALRRHLGVCLDTCHAAVEFEAPVDAFRRFEASGICVAKIQVSAGLRLCRPNREALRELARFDEGVYLHQVVVRRGTELLRFLDLSEALAAIPPDDSANSDDGTEWRVHFHVPVFEANLGAFGSTQEELAELLVALGRDGAKPQLEVETYTWDVLPSELRSRPLVDAIAREIEWTQEQWLRGATA